MKPVRRPALRALSILVLSGAVASCVDNSPTIPGAPLAPTPSAAILPQAVGVVPGRVLVGMRAGASPTALAALNNLAAERGLGADIWVFRVPERAEAAIAQALSRSPNVRFAEPDYVRTFGDLTCAICALTGGSFMGYKWDLQNDGVIVNASGTVLANTGVVGADLNWTPAYQQLGPNFPQTVVVAILDSGVRSDHEDLAGRVVGGWNFNAGNGNYADDNGHGTHVAGIIGARGGNGKGIAGNAWGPGVRFLAVKVCGQSIFGYTCPDSQIYQGINWAVAQGAKVINISLGGAASSNSVRTALQNARTQGVLPVCAAGNNSSVVSYPAAFPECVAVSATNWSDGFASYSNYGSQVDLSAPGGDIENSSGYSYILSSYNSSATSYAFMAGTSMATPQVTGLAALLYSQGMTDDDAVLEVMKNSSDDLGAAGYDTRFGFGRINVGNALALMSGGPPPPPPGNQPPTADFSYSCSALTCNFTDTSSDSDGTVNAWSWNFGDGTSSTQRNPSHTYTSEASFTVTLTATDDDNATGTRSKTVSTASTPTLVTADFTFSCTNLTCQFTNQSTHQNGVNLLANWDMGDNSGMKMAWSPTHTYAQAGTYEVIMVVLAEDFSGWNSKRKMVTVSQSAPPPPTGPTAGYTHSCTFLTCTFTDASTQGSSAISSRVWSFGDNTANGSGTSVQHTFASSGTYQVTLTVTDANNLSDPETKSVAVQPAPTPPNAGYTYSCTFLTCTFTDASTQGSSAISSRVWSFGDNTANGSGSSVQHTFASGGTYQVTLTVTDANNLSDPETKSVTVQAQPTLSLTARGYKVRGRHTVDLVWSGAASSQVVILRNNVVVALRPNMPSSANLWTHATSDQGSAAYTYRVCQADAGGNPTGICSPSVPVLF